ncbi:hypothetical protein BKA67DRAFT_546785 [Truncatella angustata]|uniref:Uncharacterized protein n=1 Tax=Truncatella angustata TaxID=152316 RepID=A0A9P8UXC8_9PEZI|nr:uncharacterized protein BKA67DRAFT_546785 [Truncatella angustata]KAH6660087.1 hypothetical protein BKA67DRAFT_546785 [Truncatella angustata]
MFPKRNDCWHISLLPLFLDGRRVYSRYRAMKVSVRGCSFPVLGSPMTSHYSAHMFCKRKMSDKETRRQVGALRASAGLGTLATEAVTVSSRSSAQPQKCGARHSSIIGEP